MRFVSLATIALGAVVGTAILGANSQPVEAGPACNRLDLNSPCIRGNDLRSRLNLDDGRNARVRLRDADGENGIVLNAGPANLTNLFSNEEDESNGLVKAWAQINADGSIDSCWRCNTDTAETRRLVTGQYEVDFTPLAADITGRPLSAVVGGLALNQLASIIDLADRSGDASSVFVNTTDAAGTNSDRSFVLIIY